MFIYSSQVNRFGFIAEITQNQDFADLIESWEAIISDDFQPLLFTLAKTQLQFPGVFKTTSYKNVEFRYLDSSQVNFGICYGLLDNYFLFTFSGESMIRLIDLILAT